MTKLNMDLVCQVAVVVPDLKKGLESFRRLFGIDEDSLSYSDSTDAYREGRLKEVKYRSISTPSTLPTPISSRLS